MPFWVCGWWLAVTYCWVSLQHSASMARVLAEARPPGEEEPVPTLRLFRQAEQLCQHEHLLRQQHTRECPCQLVWTGLRRIWCPPHPNCAGSYSKKRSWGGLWWGGVSVPQGNLQWGSWHLWTKTRFVRPEWTWPCPQILWDRVSLSLRWGAAYPPCFSYGVLALVCACAMLGWLEMLKAIIDSNGLIGAEYAHDRMGTTCPFQKGLQETCTCVDAGQTIKELSSPGGDARSPEF